MEVHVMAIFDHHKAVAAMAYLANKAPDRSIGYYALVKLMYLADKEYFHRRGRTITGDVYARMDNGSTGSDTYNLVKEIRGVDTPKRPLRSFLEERFRVIGDHPRLFVVSLRSADMDELSPGEVQVLDEIFEKHGHKTFKQLKALAHDRAWSSKPQEENWWISYEELAEGDQAIIDYLRVAGDEIEIPGQAGA